MPALEAWTQFGMPDRSRYEGLPPNVIRTRAAQSRDRGVDAVRRGRGENPPSHLTACVTPGRRRRIRAGLSDFPEAISARPSTTRSKRTLHPRDAAVFGLVALGLGAVALVA
jgi:hypothetical protein